MEPARKELGEFMVLAIVVSGGALGAILAALSGVRHYSSVPTAAFVASSLIVGASVGYAKIAGGRWAQLVVFVFAMVYGFIFAPMLF